MICSTSATLSRNLTSADTGRDRLAPGANFSPVIAVNADRRRNLRAPASPPQPVMLGAKNRFTEVCPTAGIQLAIRDFDEQPRNTAPSIRRRCALQRFHRRQPHRNQKPAPAETQPTAPPPHQSPAQALQHRLGQHHRIHCVICYRISRGTTSTGQRDPCHRLPPLLPSHHAASITVHHWNHPLSCAYQLEPFIRSF